MSKGPPLWVIYYRPTDTTEIFDYIARRFVYNSEQSKYVPDWLAYGHDEIEPLRKMLAKDGLVKLDRAKTDHPAILETWL